MSEAFPNSPAHLLKMRQWSSSLICLRALENGSDSDGAGASDSGSIWDSPTEDGLSRFDNLIRKLVAEPQLATRKYIEFSITRVLCLDAGIRIPSFIRNQLSIINYTTSSISAGIIISYMHILTDLVKYFPIQQETLQLIFDEIQPWLLYNNHLVRATAMSTFLIIYKILPSPQGGPALMGAYLDKGRDNKKFMQKYNCKPSKQQQQPLLSPLSPITMELIFDLLPSMIPNFPAKELINPSHFLPLNVPIHSDISTDFSVSSPTQSPSPSPIESKVTSPTPTPLQTPTQTPLQLKPSIVLEMEKSTYYQKSTSSFKLILIASLLESPQNIAGLTRTSEVMGIELLVLPKLAIIDGPEFKRVSMSAEKWCPFQECKPDDLKSLILSLRAKYRIVGVEQTSSSTLLSDAVFFGATGAKGICLILGNEKHGIPAEYLHLVDECIEIPQWGLVKSMNVHVSASLVIWEARRQWLLQ